MLQQKQLFKYSKIYQSYSTMWFFSAEHLLTSHRALTVLDKFCYKLRKDIDRETVSDFIFWAPKSLQMVTAAMKLKDAYSLEGKLWPT